MAARRDAQTDVKYADWFDRTPRAGYLLQRGDGRALPAIVGVPVHVEDLLSIHRHDPRQDAFLGNTGTGINTAT